MALLPMTMFIAMEPLARKTKLQDGVFLGLVPLPVMLLHRYMYGVTES